MLACIKANLHLQGISMRRPPMFDILRHAVFDCASRQEGRKEN